MKFFIDTADLDDIREASSWGCLSGVTTNPSLYAKTGGKLADFEAAVESGRRSPLMPRDATYGLSLHKISAPLDGGWRGR